MFELKKQNKNNMNNNDKSIPQFPCQIILKEKAIRYQNLIISNHLHQQKRHPPTLTKWATPTRNHIRYYHSQNLTKIHFVARNAIKRQGNLYLHF